MSKLRGIHSLDDLNKAIVMKDKVPELVGKRWGGRYIKLIVEDEGGLKKEITASVNEIVKKMRALYKDAVNEKTFTETQKQAGKEICQKVISLKGKKAKQNWLQALGTWFARLKNVVGKDRKSKIVGYRNEIINQQTNKSPKSDQKELPREVASVDKVHIQSSQNSAVDSEIANQELANPIVVNPEIDHPISVNPEPADPIVVNPEPVNPEPVNPELANPKIDHPIVVNHSSSSEVVSSAAKTDPYIIKIMPKKQDYRWNLGTKFRLPHLYEGQERSDGKIWDWLFDTHHFPPLNICEKGLDVTYDPNTNKESKEEFIEKIREELERRITAAMDFQVYTERVLDELPKKLQNSILSERPSYERYVKKNP